MRIALKPMGTALMLGLGFILAQSSSAALAQDAAPQNLVYVTNQNGGVTVLDARTFKPVADIAVGKSPRGLAVTPDGRWLLTANQETADVSVVDTATRQEVRRIPIGPGVEFIRVLPNGTRAFVAYEPSSKGKPPGPGGKHDAKDDDDGDAPAELAEIDLKTWTVVGRAAASPETESIEFSPDQRTLLVANEGDDTIGIYDIAGLKKIKTVDVSAHGSRPRGVKVSPDGAFYVVTLENSDNFLLMDKDFTITKTVATGKGPYGAAFSPDGRQIWIAAARSGQIQVFDTRSLAPVASIPVGKRCWHFTFTPDGGKALAACGRSDAVDVIDAKDDTVLQTLDGFKMPWGVVTYPQANGSLDAAAKQ